MRVNKYFLQFLKSNKDQRWELPLWLIVHISIPVILLLSLFFIGPVSINTSLFDMLPQSRQLRAVMEADALLGERNGREIIILGSSSDFQNAKNGAVLLYGEFKNSYKIEDISFYFDSSVIDDFYRYLFDYRFVIAADDTLALLESGRPEEIAYDALAIAFGAFNFFSLDNIDKDPFMLVERHAMEFLSSSLLTGGLSLKDDVLAAEKDGIWYVMLRITLAHGAVSLRSDRNVIGQIYNVIPAIKESVQDIEFYFSGVPFHSYESSSSAQREISIISTVTLLLILLLFLLVFRSVVPVVFSIADIIISLGIAAAASLLIFREIHIITFVFGTTLIGTGVDYSVHFFVHWKNNTAIKNGYGIRSHIIKNITMSFVSTLICFLFFFFAPFPILKQFAVFSIAGLISSYLTFFCIYPRLKLKQERNLTTKAQKARKGISIARLFNSFFCAFAVKKTRLVAFVILITAAIILLIVNSSNIKIENNLTSLYTMSDNLLKSEIKTAQILDYGSPGWYFIVSGSTEQETLENEEKLAARLQEEIANGNMENFLATTLFVPSIKNQKKTYRAMEALLPLAAFQFEYLGFPPEYAVAFKEEFAVSEIFCLPHNAPAQAGISNLWIGQMGGNFYSCVMPLKPKDETVFRSIAEEFEFVHFVNKAKDIGHDMDTLTRTMLLLFLAAYIIVSVIICFVFPRKDSIKICSIPLLLAAAALAVLAVNSIPIGFFSVVALVLVFGLSLDYIFFMTGKKNREEKKITFLGVTLSFLTALFSFGALVLSSFMPVHLFGLTVCAGLGAAFISALILQSRTD